MKAASDFTECKKTSSVRKETNRLREQISRLQLFYLMMWVILATGYLTLPFAISHFTQRDGWLVPIPFLAGIWLVFLLTLAFSRHFPRQTITEGLQTALGSLVGGFLSFILSIWFFIFICIVVRELVTFVDVTILPETPYYVTAAVVLASVAYAVSLGLEGLGRIAEIVTPMVMVLSASLLLLALQHADFTHIQPILADNWHPVLKGSVLPWTFAVELCLVIPLSRYLKGPAIKLRDGFIFGLILAVIGILIELAVIAVLRSTLQFSNYPILEAVRTISYGQFFEHLDPLYVVAITLTILVKLSVIQYGWVVELQQLLKLKDYRPAVWSTSFAAWAGSIFLFPNTTALNDFMLFSAFSYFVLTVLLSLSLAVGVQSLRSLIHGSDKSPNPRH